MSEQKSALTFDPEAGKNKTKKEYEIYPEGKSEGVCFRILKIDEEKAVWVDSKSGTDEPTSSNIKWGHTHLNTDTGQHYKNSSNDGDWEPEAIEATRQSNALQFHFCTVADFEKTYPDGEILDGVIPDGAWLKSKALNFTDADNGKLRETLLHWGIEMPHLQSYAKKEPRAWEELREWISENCLKRHARLNVKHNKGTKWTFANIITLQEV